MTPEQRARLLDIRWRGKTGKHLSEEDQTFAILMHASYPHVYRDVEEEIQLTYARLHGLIYSRHTRSRAVLP